MKIVMETKEEYNAFMQTVAEMDVPIGTRMTVEWGKHTLTIPNPSPELQQAILAACNLN